MVGFASVRTKAGTAAGARTALCTAVLLAACGGGGSGSDGVVAGSLQVTDCVIPAGGSACQATVSWTTTAATSPRVVAGGTALSTSPSGTASLPVGVDPVTVTLFSGNLRLDEQAARGSCAPASAWDGACRAFATRSTARAPTPFMENGVPVTLEVVIYTPPGSGPFPTVMFNHGSTGDGSDPSLFTVTYTSEAVARYFAERGWLVAFPQRRGRGQSGGRYDEGFTPDRSRYSCVAAPALAGFEHALDDLDAAVDYLRSHADVDPTRMLSAGTSRGGVLAIAHLAHRPDVYLGGVNFVGGWLGEGCGDYLQVNRLTFEVGASFPGESLWLYARDDSFYSLDHSQANFAAFGVAGGQGEFRTFQRAAGLNGHFLVNDPPLWGADLEAYLAGL